MRSWESDATVTSTGTLVIATPPDVLPGSYRVVVVVETRPDLPVTSIATPQEDPWDTLARIGAQLSVQGPLPFSAVDELSRSRR